MTMPTVKIRLPLANYQKEAQMELLKDGAFLVTFRGKRLDPPPHKGMISTNYQPGCRNSSFSLLPHAERQTR